jgi:hypothetical protein
LADSECLIVDGEPNADDKPELGREECFPEALKYRLGPDGELTDERQELIAGRLGHGQARFAGFRVECQARPTGRF